VATLLEKIDVGGLASRVGLSEDRSSAGLAALLPLVLRFIDEDGGAMGSLKAIAKTDDAIDGLKGLGGKLFG
jgi:hypothetical protein